MSGDAYPSDSVDGFLDADVDSCPRLVLYWSVCIKLSVAFSDGVCIDLCWYLRAIAIDLKN